MESSDDESEENPAEAEERQMSFWETVAFHENQAENQAGASFIHSGTVRAGSLYPVRPTPRWPLPAIRLADRVVPVSRHRPITPIQPSSIEYRLGHFALHEGCGPRALAVIHDMLVSDLHYEVREGLCSQAMLASHCRLICARFDALRRGVRRAVDEGEDVVWVCEPVYGDAVNPRVRPDREHSGQANSAPVASQPTYGARRRNIVQTIRPEPYDVLDTRRLDALAYSSRRNPVP